MKVLFVGEDITWDPNVENRSGPLN